MDKKKKEKIINLCKEIASDAEQDITEFEGKPFNGKTVSVLFGNQAAAISALANLIEAIVTDKED